MTTRRQRFLNSYERQQMRDCEDNARAAEGVGLALFPEELPRESIVEQQCTCFAGWCEKHQNDRATSYRKSPKEAPTVEAAQSNETTELTNVRDIASPGLKALLPFDPKALEMQSFADELQDLDGSQAWHAQTAAVYDVRAIAYLKEIDGSYANRFRDWLYKGWKLVNEGLAAKRAPADAVRKHFARISQAFRMAEQRRVDDERRKREAEELDRAQQARAAAVHHAEETGNVQEAQALRTAPLETAPVVAERPRVPDSAVSTGKTRYRAKEGSPIDIQALLLSLITVVNGKPSLNLTLHLQLFDLNFGRLNRLLDTMAGNSLPGVQLESYGVTRHKARS